MRIKSSLALLCFSALFAHAAVAQSPPGRGWEGSIGLFHQGSKEVSFNGGAALSTENDFGVVAGFGYNFNSKLDLIVGFESASIGYELVQQSATTPGLTRRIATDYEAFTPIVKLNYNFSDRPLTPFVSAGLGWSFIDTNIPTGTTFIDCWFDPWYGYLCGAFDETKTTDAFTYQLGVGARWRINDVYGLRFEYNKQWVDFERSNGTPGFDQFKLTLVLRYW